MESEKAAKAVEQAMEIAREEQKARNDAKTALKEMEAKFKDADRERKLVKISLENHAGADSTSRKYDEQIAELAKQNDDLTAKLKHQKDQLTEAQTELQENYDKNQKDWEEDPDNVWWREDTDWDNKDKKTKRINSHPEKVHAMNLVIKSPFLQGGNPVEAEPMIAQMKRRISKTKRTSKIKTTQGKEKQKGG